MKKTLLSLALAAITSAAFAAEVTETTTTTTTTGNGTITEFTPGSALVVKESTGPVRYRYGKTVTYVTKSGKVLTDEEVKTRIRIGLPISVRFSSEGDNKVVERVIVED